MVLGHHPALREESDPIWVEVRSRDEAVRQACVGRDTVGDHVDLRHRDLFDPVSSGSSRIRRTDAQNHFLKADSFVLNQFECVNRLHIPTPSYGGLAHMVVCA